MITLPGLVPNTLLQQLQHQRRASVFTFGVSASVNHPCPNEIGGYNMTRLADYLNRR
jgi:hypothetical protein